MLILIHVVKDFYVYPQNENNRQQNFTYSARPLKTFGLAGPGLNPTHSLA